MIGRRSVHLYDRRMGAVRRVARGLRPRLRGSVLLIALVMGTAGGLATGLVSGAIGTRTAVDRLIAATHVPDVMLVDPTLDEAQLDEIRDLPEVEGAALLAGLGLFDPGGQYFGLTASVDGRYGIELDAPNIVRGRLASPDAEDEVVLGEKSAEALGLDVGDVIHFKSYSPEQMAGWDPVEGPTDEQLAEFRGPDVDVEVVGINRHPADLTSDDPLSYFSVLPPGFYDEYHGRIGEYFRFAMLDLGPLPSPAEEGAVAAAVQRIGGPDARVRRGRRAGRRSVDLDAGLRRAGDDRARRSDRRGRPDRRRLAHLANGGSGGLRVRTTRRTRNDEHRPGGRDRHRLRASCGGRRRADRRGRRRFDGVPAVRAGPPRRPERGAPSRSVAGRARCHRNGRRGRGDRGRARVRGGLPPARRPAPPQRHDRSLGPRRHAGRSAGRGRPRRRFRPLRPGGRATSSPRRRWRWRVRRASVRSCSARALLTSSPRPAAYGWTWDFVVSDDGTEPFVDDSAVEMLAVVKHRRRLARRTAGRRARHGVDQGTAARVGRRWSPARQRRDRAGSSHDGRSGPRYRRRVARRGQRGFATRCAWWVRRCSPGSPTCRRRRGEPLSRRPTSSSSAPGASRVRAPWSASPTASIGRPSRSGSRTSSAEIGGSASAPETPIELARLREIEALPWILTGFLGLVGLVAVVNAVVTTTRRRAHHLAVLRSIGLAPRKRSRRCRRAVGGLGPHGSRRRGAARLDRRADAVAGARRVARRGGARRRAVGGGADRRRSPVWPSRLCWHSSPPGRPLGGRSPARSAPSDGAGGQWWRRWESNHDPCFKS